jgi:membrane protease YdiL (CAAX protease family)
MKKAFLAEAHSGRKLIFTLLIVIGSWIIFQIIGMLSGMLVFGLTLNDTLNSLMSTNDYYIVGFLKYVQAFTSAGMFIFASLLASWFIDDDWKSFIGLKKNPGWLISTLSIVFIIIILPFTNLLTYYNANMGLPDFLSGLENFFHEKENQMTDIMESFLKPGGIGGLPFNLLVIAIIPAIGEELLFRGVIQKLLIRWFGNVHWAIFVTSFIFSAMHIQFLSFLPRFFLGMILGYLFYWSGSVWLTIMVHFINNAVATIFYFFFYGGYTGDFLEQVGTPERAPMGAFIGGLLGFSLLYFIYRKALPKNQSN